MDWKNLLDDISDVVKEAGEKIDAKAKDNNIDLSRLKEVNINKVKEVNLGKLKDVDLNKIVTFNKTGYRHHYCRLD